MEILEKLSGYNLKIRLPINYRQYKMASSTAQNGNESQGVSEMELEKKIKDLQDEFVRIPRDLIKSALSVNDGDLSKARKQLAESIKNATLFYPNFMATKPSGVSTQSSSDSAKEFEGSVNNAGNSFSVTDNGKGKYQKRVVGNFNLEL